MKGGLHARPHPERTLLAQAVDLLDGVPEQREPLLRETRRRALGARGVAREPFHDEPTLRGLRLHAHPGAHSRALVDAATRLPLPQARELRRGRRRRLGALDRDHARRLARARHPGRRALGARRTGTRLNRYEDGPGQLRVFAYGTLELPELVLQITGRRFRSERATLEGFARSMLRGAAYPGIAPNAGARTPGTLYLDVDPESLAALDRFEGDLYQRREVTLTTSSGKRTAFAWVLRAEQQHLLTGEPWDRDRFVAHHLREWLAGVSIRDMEINGIAHLFVSTGDFARARAFYAQLLPFLGMKPVLDGEGFYYCVGGRTAFGLRPATPEYAGQRFDQGRPGLHHVCFRARAREDVDTVHVFAREIGARIVHPPEEGSWAPGYYSVLFEDPDGVRLEVNFVPGRGLLEEKR
ncbi:MAG: hypothetical protein E4H11_02470 [Myxococcales bacterium]|nr:MAG: hypothetical protein E4H11_02470 [Myxococcales bacterium]